MATKAASPSAIYARRKPALSQARPSRATARFGNAVEHSFDFGEGEGRRFGVFDAGKGDGGDVTLLSPEEASFAATEDGGAGFQLFVGPNCPGLVNAAALTDSWLIARTDPSPSAPLQGQAVVRLEDLREGRQKNCPAQLDTAFTQWYVRPVCYLAADGQGAPITLTTLISEHYGGESPDSAGHVERFYFTRELGSTRWERWQNLSPSRHFCPDQVAKRASDLAASDRFGKAETPGGGALCHGRLPRMDLDRAARRPLRRSSRVFHRRGAIASPRGLSPRHAQPPRMSFRRCETAPGEDCPGKVSRRQEEGNQLARFVLAGLGLWSFSPRT